MRRMARTEAFIVGAAVASRPKQTVVYAAPPAVPYGYPPPQTVVYSAPQQPPPRQDVIIETAPSYPPQQPGAYPPRESYPPPAAYPPPASYPPASCPPSYVPPASTVVEVARPPAPAPAVVAPVAAAAVAGAAIAAAERRHFYIVNEANCAVLGVERASIKPGTNAVIDKRRPDKAFHQIWYLDADGVIRSKLNDFALESKKIDDRVKLVPYVGDARQMWTVEGNRIVNKLMRTECLGLRKHLRLKDDADVIRMIYEGKPYQHWRMEPIII